MEMEDAPHGQEKSKDHDDSGGGEEAGKADGSGGENQKRSVNKVSEDQIPDQTKRTRTLNLIDLIKRDEYLIPSGLTTALQPQARPRPRKRIYDEVTMLSDNVIRQWRQDPSRNFRKIKQVGVPRK